MISKLPTPADVIKGKLAERADWIVLNVSTTNMAWTTTVQNVKYLGTDIWIMPVMEGYFPAITARRPSDVRREDIELILMRFLSALCWAEVSGATVEYITGGDLPRPLGREKTRGVIIRDKFGLEYLPEATDEKGKLALALMREGRALQLSTYSFLSLYRAFELCVPGKKRGHWIEQNLPKVANHRAKEQIAKLRSSGVSDIGAHIQKARRQAIAHATEGKIIDPDSMADSREVSSDLPIMDAIAELAIEMELGIQTSHTAYSEHLYELAGFKSHFGEEFVRMVRMGETPDANYEIDVPNIDFGLLNVEPFTPLLKLSIVDAAYDRQVLQFAYRSQSGYFTVIFRIDLANERLMFDIHNGIYGPPDDGTALYAEEAAEIHKFTKQYLGNGSIVIRNSDTGAMLSRVDPYIPLNMMPNFDYMTQEIEKWEKLARERRA